MKKNIAAAWSKLNQEHKIVLAVALLSALTVLLLGQWKPDAGDLPPAPRSEAVDTYIPRGFVLVPIEVENYEALDSILGRFGQVDLFQAGSLDGRDRRLVARNIRILRAPQNPSHFAVLIKESEVSQILAHGGSFIVIVKPRGEAGTEFVKYQQKKRRRITYDGG